MIAVCCGFRVFAALLGSWGLRRLPPHAQTRLSSRWGALISGAPIRAGGASPLRVATGGDANWRFKARLRRSPASTNRRRGWRLWIKSPIESGSPWDSIPGLLTTKSVLVCSPRDSPFFICDLDKADRKPSRAKRPNKNWWSEPLIVARQTTPSFNGHAPATEAARCFLANLLART
jgi:hypothetical protein